jgi:ammonium transporter, Amt family
MTITWLRSGRPDLGMTLNGTLAGLVAITAGCAYVDPLSAIIIGLIVVFASDLLEKLKIDDPVSTVPVHLFNLYGGGMTLLISQFVGVIAIGLWSAALAGALFLVLKATIGLRISKEEEEAGLDIGEHGSIAYPDLGLAGTIPSGASAD